MFRFDYGHGTLKKSIVLGVFMSLVMTSCFVFAGDTTQQPADIEGHLVGHRWLIGAQITEVSQFHPAFHAPYSNPAISFGPKAKIGWSLTTSLFAAVSPWHGGILLAEPEYANGRGMPNPSGLGGYPNGEITRTGAVGKYPPPYIARAFYHQDFFLSEKQTPESSEFEGRLMPSGIHELGYGHNAERIEITVGEFACNDFFDMSTIATDPRHHFLNWALMEQGAWDFAADARGYTYGIVAVWEMPRFALRGGTALMPKVANGPDLSWNIAHNHSEMVEGEVRYRFFEKPGSAKVMMYVNHAHMGNYATALASTLPGTPPDITSVERTGNIKFGGGLLMDQQITHAFSVFFRAGADDGQTETFVFTEVDRSFSFGADTTGSLWRRPNDHAALGVAFNGLSRVHVQYLAAGGNGFQLGDGKLHNAWEAIVEFSYLTSLTKYVGITPDIQVIVNPGMNADRGPTEVFGLRLHTHI